MNRETGERTGRRYVVSPADLRALVAEAHERARAIVVDELVDQLLPAYREALDEHLGRAAHAAAEPTASAPEPAPGTAEAPSPGDRAWYVYAVARSEDLADFAGMTGIDNEAVHAVLAGRLAALASEPELAGFQAAEEEPELSEEGWLARALRAHDAVVAHAFAAAPVLPLRFGALYPTRDDVVEMLRSRADDLTAEIDRLAPTSEWDVKAYVGALAAEGSTPPEPADEASGGAAWMQQRRNAAVARETVREQRTRLATEIGEQLAEHARDTYLRSETADADPDRPALDAVYLVDRIDQDRFLAVVDRLRDRYSDDILRLAVTGPLPVYHFVRLDPVGAGHG